MKKKDQNTPPLRGDDKSTARCEGNAQSPLPQWPEGVHIYSDDELYFHLKDRDLKSILEIIMAHNFSLIFAILEWIKYIAGKGDRPASRLSTMLNPNLALTGNCAKLNIDTLVKLLVVYGEGRCPQVKVLEYCINSTLTLLHKLKELRPSTHIEKAEEAIAAIFECSLYQGDPTMSEHDYEMTLYGLMNTFLSECSENARELSVFLAEAVARIEKDDDAARVYRTTSHNIQVEERLELMSRGAFHAGVKAMRETVAENNVENVLPRNVGRPKTIDYHRRGPNNTELMQEQRTAVISYAYIDKHKHPEDITLEDVIRVWNLPKNKTRWDAGAGRKDAGKGYKNCKILHSVIMNLVHKKGFDINKIITHL